jgi:hypothetical protein
VPADKRTNSASVVLARCLSRSSSRSTAVSGRKNSKSSGRSLEPIQCSPRRVRSLDRATYRAWGSTRRTWGGRKLVTATASSVSPCTPWTVVPNAGTIGKPLIEMDDSCNVIDAVDRWTGITDAGQCGGIPGKRTGDGQLAISR